MLQKDVNSIKYTLAQHLLSQILFMFIYLSLFMWNKLNFPYNYVFVTIEKKE